MALYENFMEPCAVMEKKRTSDSEGGFVTTWEQGTEFNAAVVRDTSMQARVAEKEGVSNVYTVTMPKNAMLDFHDVFKRLRDGQIFRVTSNADDKQTPDVASFSFAQASAEEWSLTT